MINLRHFSWPSVRTYAYLLQECTRKKALAEGKQIHAHILCSLGTSAASDTFLGNTLVNMYAKCGSLPHACRLFDAMPTRNVFSWTIIISSYAKVGRGMEAVSLFERMRREGVEPNRITFIGVLKAFSGLGSLSQAKKVHDLIKMRGLESDVVVGSTLVDVYSKCGSVDDARRVFDGMQIRNPISWNVMISGYAHNGGGEEALALFRRMKQEGIEPNKVTFISALKACASLGALVEGNRIHESIEKKGFASDVFIASSLVDMYVKCGCIREARRVFDGMHQRDVVLWNAIIVGYAHCGRLREALVLLERMEREDVRPSEITFACALKVCASLGTLEEGKKVHWSMEKKGVALGIVLGSALVDMYLKCGSLEDAREVFDGMSERNVILWNAMIAGYAQSSGYEKESLVLFERMQEGEGGVSVEPNEATFASVLKACASLATLEQGKKVHAKLKKSGLELDVFVGSSLVDMYSKCGSIGDAWQVFEGMRDRNVVTWTAMIAGYAKQGHGKEALALFQKMQWEGVKPDEAAFVSILTACIHDDCIAKEAGSIFDSMSREYAIAPTIKHYTCIINLLGRLGHLVEAEDIINKMPSPLSVAVWMALLCVCMGHGDTKIGKYTLQPPIGDRNGKPTICFRPTNTPNGTHLLIKKN